MSKKICSQDGCQRPAHALGYCNTHYRPAVAKGLIGPRIPCLKFTCPRFKTHNDGLCPIHHRATTVAWKAKEKRRRERPDRKEKKKIADKKYAKSEKRAATLTRYNKRRAERMLIATPRWADRAAIQALYDNCPPGYAVDHKDPIFGKIVSGLHVIENLQYLTIEENLRKGNKYEAA